MKSEQRDEFAEAGLRVSSSPTKISLLLIVATSSSLFLFFLAQRPLLTQICGSGENIIRPQNLAVPGGFKIKGTCELNSIRNKNRKVHLGMFVKHGIYTTSHIPDDCRNLVRFVLTGPRIEGEREGQRLDITHSLTHFIASETVVKMLAVRDQASFYRSLFNHMCNKKKKFKEEWRKQRDINCSRIEEFEKLMYLGEREAKSDPYLTKEVTSRNCKAAVRIQSIKIEKGSLCMLPSGRPRG